MIGSELASGTAARVKSVLRALRHRNYRLFYIGQGISLIGTWMQMVALGWLVHRLTGSAQMLGLVAFANRLTAAGLTPFAGVLIDRAPKRHTVIAAQVAAMILALLLAWLALSGRIAVWQVVVLSTALGVVNAVEVPARQSYFVELIDDRDDLGNAIALNSTLFNGARLIGPAVAGVLIAAYDEGICFLVNGLSYLAVIAALLRITVDGAPRRSEHPSVLAELREGFAYITRFRAIKALLGLVALVSFVGMPYTTLMPIYAAQTLGADSDGYGFLMTAGGLGAMIGALYLAQRRTVRGLGKVIPLASAVFGLALVLLGGSDRMWLSLLIVPLVSAGMMVQMASTNTVLQTLVPDDKRGRVISLYVMAFMGPTPFGNLLAGALAERIGVPRTFQICGLLALGAAIAFAGRLPTARDLTRPLERGAGILKDIAAGLQSASQALSPWRD